MLQKRKYLNVIVNFCSLLLAAIFIFSGFTKAVDPIGGAIKIGDYLTAFGLNTIGHETSLAVLSVIESTFEFLLGVHLLLGIRRKITSISTFVLMIFMTLLTLYIAVTDIVRDCGCFGDAIHLSNTATFLKNLVLLLAAICVMIFPQKIHPLISYKHQWIAQVYSLMFVLLVSLYSYHYLPIVDYRPYHVGQDISKAMTIPSDAKAPVFETTFTLEKNGVKKQFTLENYPDSTWTFVDSKTTMIEAGFQPEIKDFALYTFSGDEMTNSILNEKNYAFWLVLPRIENTDTGVIDAIEDIYDYCLRYGYKLYGFTASDSAKISDWLHATGISFPFYNADDIVLKTMVRSNPGLLLVKKGIILNKWSKNNLPDESKLTAALQKLSLTYGKGSYGLKHTLKYIIVFLIPLIIIIFASKTRNRRFIKSTNVGVDKEHTKNKIQ